MNGSRARLLVLLAAAALLLGCGSEVPAADTGSFARPEGLTCPTDERVSFGGGLLAEVPDGPETAEELVDARSTSDRPWVLVGRKAYVLRPDGTAFKVHDLVEGEKGWYLDGYEACATSAAD